VPEDAAACPGCGEDLLLDPLADDVLWDDSPTPAPEQDAYGSAPVQEVYTSARGTAEMSAAQAPPPPAPGRQTFGQGLQASIATKMVDADPEKDRHTRIVEVSVPAVVRRAASTPAASAPPDRTKKASQDAALDRSIEDLGDSIRLFYLRMHRIDRIAFWASVLTFVSAFLPWRNALGEGLLSGIEELGGISAGCSALVILCIYARTARRRLAGLVLLCQLILASGAVAVPVYQFFYQAGLEFQIGLYATAVLGGAVIVLTFMRLAVRSF